jgi:hypothetical protein
VWIAGKKPCWILPSGKVVPLTVQQNVPYLSEGGPHTDPSLDVVKYCGVYVNGSELKVNLSCNPALPAVGSVPAADEPEKVSSTTSLWTKTGKHGRFVARVKRGIPWERVVRRRTENLETGDLMEDVEVTDHDNPNWYRQLPKRTKIKTTFYYTTDVGGVSAADAEDPSVTTAVPAPERGEVPDPPSPDSEGTWDLDDAFFSGSLPHCLTHKPAQQDCWDCIRAKRRNVRKFAGTTRRNPQVYGDILTIDHVSMTEGFGPKAVGGAKHLLCLLDLATRFGYVGAVQSTGSDPVVYHMIHAVGKDEVGLVYSDGGSGIVSACNQLNVNSDQSQPEIHETNGIIEKYNQQIIDGTRVLLVQAGLPPVFWPYAATCYCMLSNIVDKAPNQELFPGQTKWHARTGSSFNGHVIPFGSAVYYLPTKERYTTSKAAPRQRVGIFMGYRLQTQAKWSGEYVILDMDVFVDKNLGIDAAETWGNIYHHITKRVDPIKPVCFPMKKRYDYLNNTLEGMELLHKAESPTDLSPAVLPGPLVETPPLVGGVTAADVTTDAVTTTAAGSGGVVVPDPALAPDDKSPHGYIRDRLGRRLKVDEFGYILRSTTRPKGVPVETWNKMGNAERKRVIARQKAESADPTVTERPPTGPPSGSAAEEAQPAVPAEEIEWNFDTSKGDVEISMMEFDSWGDFYLDTFRSTCTHQNGGGDSRNVCRPPFRTKSTKTKSSLNK